ncbi:MAG: GEVED domain-containing protein [Acidobacteriota bacterium]
MSLSLLVLASLPAAASDLAGTRLDFLDPNGGPAPCGVVFNPGGSISYLPGTQLQGTHYELGDSGMVRLHLRNDGTTTKNGLQVDVTLPHPMVYTGLGAVPSGASVSYTPPASPGAPSYVSLEDLTLEGETSQQLGIYFSVNEMSTEYSTTTMGTYTGLASQHYFVRDPGTDEPLVLCPNTPVDLGLFTVSAHVHGEFDDVTVSNEARLLDVPPVPEGGGGGGGEGEEEGLVPSLGNPIRGKELGHAIANQLSTLSHVATSTPRSTGEHRRFEGRGVPSLPEGPVAGPPRTDSFKPPINYGRVNDFGDAPTSSAGNPSIAYPIIRHVRVSDPLITLGAFASEEANTWAAFSEDDDSCSNEYPAPGGDPNMDGHDDGVDLVVCPAGGACLEVQATTSSQGFLNVLIDLDGDGAWECGEHALKDIPLGSSSYQLDLASAGVTPGQYWVRVTVGNDQLGGGACWPGDGDLVGGETEDYLLVVSAGPPMTYALYGTICASTGLVRQLTP